MSAVVGTYFGLPDAAHEDTSHILSDHVARDYEPRLKVGKRPDGFQIIVGIKGSGKTALRRHIEESDERALKWSLDSDHRYLAIEPASLRGRSGVLKNTLALELLRAFATHLGQGAASDAGESAKAFRAVGARVLRTLKNIPDAVKVKAGPVSLDLAALLKAQAVPVVEAAWKEAHKGVLAALRDRQAYITIDDAEDVFAGLEDNPLFIEGLARAVHDINAASQERLHVLLFLKYGVWRTWFENQQEYDRVSYVIKKMNWDHNALCELVARRAERLQKRERAERLDVEKLWAREFEWETGHSFKSFSQEFTRLCVSGPRDMIVLANGAKDAAAEGKIRLEHLQAAVQGYSEGKLFAIGADFGGAYAEIAKFIGRVFQTCPDELSGSAAADWIETHGLTDEKVDNYYRKHVWYASASKERLVALMYEIGFWGVRQDTDRVLYAIERSEMDTTDLLGASLVVHPAFRPYLSIGAPVRRRSRRPGKK